MKALYIHCSDFSYRAREKVNMPHVEEEREGESAAFENALVVFATLEKGDAKSMTALAEEFKADIEDVLSQVKADGVVLYPYSHLSSELAKASEALAGLKQLEATLKEEGMEVHRAPFGWYKAFDMSCIGHPLSELSRSF